MSKDKIIGSLFEELEGLECNVSIGGVKIEGSLEGSITIGQWNKMYIPLLSTLEFNAPKPLDNIRETYKKGLTAIKIKYPFDLYENMVDEESGESLLNTIQIQLASIYLTNIKSYKVNFENDKIKHLNLFYKDGTEVKIYVLNN